MAVFIIVLGIFAIFILYPFAKIAKALLSLVISLVLFIIKVCTGGRFGLLDLANSSQINHLTNKTSSLTNRSSLTDYKHKQSNMFYKNKKANKQPHNDIIESESKTIKVEKPAGPTKSIFIFLGSIFEFFGTILDLFG